MIRLHTILILAAALAMPAAFAGNVPLQDYNTVTDPVFSSRKPMKPMTTAPTPPSPRLETLDVMGVGLTLEKFRQSQAWNELQKHSIDSILPSDVNAYEKDSSIRDLISEQRAANALEFSASNFVEFWPIPSVSVWPFCHKKEEPDDVPGKTNYAWFYDRVNDLIMPAGMHTHDIASLGSYFADEPEDILERASPLLRDQPGSARAAVAGVGRRPRFVNPPATGAVKSIGKTTARAFPAR